MWLSVQGSTWDHSVACTQLGCSCWGPSLSSACNAIHTLAVRCVSGILFAAICNLNADPGAWPPSLFCLGPGLRHSGADQIFVLPSLGWRKCNAPELSLAEVAGGNGSLPTC